MSAEFPLFGNSVFCITVHLQNLAAENQEYGLVHILTNCIRITNCNTLKLNKHDKRKV